MSRLAFVGYGLFGALVIGLLAFITLRPIQVLPRIALAPGFVVLDQDEQPLTSEDLRGAITLYNFSYSGCRPPCPDTTAVMQAVAQKLPTLDTKGVPVRLVTLSVDPARDTAEVLHDFGARYGADFTQWRFATAEAGRLKHLIGGGFGIYYQVRPDGTLVLDPAFMLVDGNGLLRAEYRTANPNLDIILRDIRLVAMEAVHSAGPGRLAYEAAHLFVCYPR
ncbi:MAG: SCO family protein [Anaerolineales bacterium]|nr:SCO family protein [Anaerolineales bacterium]